jgi:hypothetical protein
MPNKPSKKKVVRAWAVVNRNTLSNDLWNDDKALAIALAIYRTKSDAGLSRYFDGDEVKRVTITIE